MIPPVKSEIHCNIQNFVHTVSASTDKVMKLNPKLILGSSFLFDYNHDNKVITLSDAFKDLLKLLVALKELDPKILEASNLFELNEILQKPQGPGGGMLRKEGTERWHMNDATVLVENYAILENLFEKLGFSNPREITSPLTVRHCILFGARAERMEKRINETVRYLNANLSVTDHLFLLGSKRKLIPEELKFLQEKLNKLEDPSEKIFWTETFENPAESHEANAYMFLWKYLVPKNLQIQYNGKLVGIHATRIGSSYNVDQGHRPTTEITSEDWTTYYVESQFQTIFALVEQPYVRLSDQLRMTVLTDKEKAPWNALIERINRTVFYFVMPATSTRCLKCVVFDEIGRHVYRTVKTLKYLDTL